MILDAAHKAEGGKMVRICLELEGNTVKRAAFTGDFFMEPDEEIDELVAEIKGATADTDEIRERILHFFDSREIFLFGVSPEDFVSVTLKAMEKAKERRY